MVIGDILGFELKKNSPKITFGDFSASEYLFSKNTIELNKLNNFTSNITRSDFLKYFGTEKKHRYSWSGHCVPHYGYWNDCGQMLKFDIKYNLYALYSYDKDTRLYKENLPEYLKKGIVYIALWKYMKLKACIENKFNVNGFFICKKVDNKYEKICFGKPFSFTIFCKNIKNGNIFFDSGMYDGNTRNYSQFRSNTDFWNSLITEEYA